MPTPLQKAKTDGQECLSYFESHCKSEQAEQYMPWYTGTLIVLDQQR